MEIFQKLPCDVQRYILPYTWVSQPKNLLEIALKSFEELDFISKDKALKENMNTTENHQKSIEISAPKKKRKTQTNSAHLLL